MTKYQQNLVRLTKDLDRMKNLKSFDDYLNMG
jgi:hypothetical protein